MPSKFLNLNEYQKAAVFDDSPAVLVNARVGSGKTQVLISKIFYLYKRQNVKLDEMMVLTFTNKAANEIKQRILSVFPTVDDDIEMSYFGTFHSVALKLLSTILPIEDLGYRIGFTIIEPVDLEQMAHRLIYDHSLKIKFANKLPQRLEAYQAGKKKYANMKFEDDIELLVQHLQDEKIKQNLMDFDDLIQNATVLLKQHYFRPKWIIVDEFQDCDRHQLEFINVMMSPNTKVFVVGDPDQIIYSWRGSRLNLFSEFKKQHNAKELSLPINYRSSGTILEAAKCFLKDNNALDGIREQGSRIAIKNHYDPFNEAQYLCNMILQLKDKGVEFNDIAVFYRLQKQSKPLEDAFSRAGIPFQVSLIRTLRDIPVLHWFVQLLKAATNTDDMNSLIFLLNDAQFGDGLASSQAKKLISTPDNSKSGLLLKKIRKFNIWCEDNPALETVFSIYDYFELDDRLCPTSSTYTENRRRISNLVGNLYMYIVCKKFDLLSGIKEFLHSSSLYGVDILHDDIRMTQNSVKLMTLHASKGLEFKHVFIVGANYGYIPLPTKSPEEQDEERRLFFVGITRAKDNLEISYYTSPDDMRVLPGASPYISMIPAHLIEGEDISRTDVDFQSFRREIRLNIESKMSSNPMAPKSDETQLALSGECKPRVRHKKYGEGIVESEDDETITVNFTDYGIKSFVKLFSSLEYL